MAGFCFGVVLLVVGTVVLVRLVMLHRVTEQLRKELETMRLELGAFKREVRGTAPAPAPTVVPPPAEPAAHVPPPVITPAEPPTPPPIAPQPVAPSPPPPVVPQTPRPIPPIAAPRPRKPAFDWESLVGVKLFSWIAGVALVLAAVFFLKYSVEHGWLSPAVRAAIGIITGMTLLVVCELRVARGYAATANSMHGAGIAILYSTLFATYALWHLLPGTLVFALMLVVTAVAVMLSIRRDSVFIALLGLMGGFATPALLSTGDNRPVGLFSYLLLLNAGLAWVAFRKGWPILTAGSLLFTVLYQWAWIGEFLTASQLPLAAAIFAVFAMIGSSALWMRGGFGARSRPDFKRVALASAILPLAFAVFGSAVPAYGARYNVLFGFLLLMTAGLAAIAATRGPQWLHALGGVAAVLTFVIWSSVSYTHQAWPAILGWAAAFVVLYLVAGLRISSYATVTAGVLLFLFPVLVIREQSAASPALLFTVLFALLALIAAFAIARREGLVYFTGAFFAIVAEGVWSAKYLTAPRLGAALLVYGAFAILFLGVPAIARRMKRTLAPDGGTAVTVILSLCVLFFLTGQGIAPEALLGLALLLAITLAGTFVEAAATCRPWLAGAVVILGWIVLASWWAAVPVTLLLVPALSVVAIFAITALAGSIWSARNAESGQFGYTAHLALAAHLFLVVVAAQPDLSIPPWPMFAVLALLAVAIGTAALYLRLGSLLIGGVIGSQIVLMTWAAVARQMPWPDVAMVAAVIVVAYAITWFALANKLTIKAVTPFLWAAVIAPFLAEIVGIIAGGLSEQPLFVSLLSTHVVLLLAIMALAWVTESHAIVIAAVLMTAIATGLARTNTPSQEFTFAAVLYGLFIAYPLLLGTRTRRAFAPYLGAVLAGVPFFFFARDAMVDAHLDWMIGVLPLGQALLMIALLLRLLRLDAPGERQITRLATVAGAALAFITVAIPLQLDRQWITIGWALEGAALVWLFTRIPHRGLLAWSGGLLAIVFVRLVFNPAVFSYHPSSHTPIFNWYLYTYLVAAASYFFAASRWPRHIRGGVIAGNVAGTILLFSLLNIEIADYFSTGRAITFDFFSSSLAQDLTYTIGWALFAIAMLIAGIVLNTKAARVAAILLLVVTVLKCFLHDLARLGGLYRVGSLLGLAASLVLVGVLLQKFVMSKATRAREETV